MNKNIFSLFALTATLLILGFGCTTKISSIPTTTVVATADINCVAEGRQPTGDAKCCAGLEVVAIDNAYEVCGKPGTGYKPKSCMAEGETPFIDTPKCCANLEPILKGDKYVCTNLSAITTIKYTNNAYGFSLELPSTWKSYVVKNRTLDWGASGRSDSIDFGFLTQDSLFNISVHTKNQWQKIKMNDGLAPTYLGENNQYVFAFGMAQYSANDAMVARMSEIKEIMKTFKATPLPSTMITYYLLRGSNLFCDGENMDSTGYKSSLTKKIIQTVPGSLTIEERIKTTLALAAEAQSFNKTYTRTNSTTFENGIVTMHSASGWAGSSIFYCAWTPFVERNLEQFLEIKKINWQADQ